MVMKLMKAERAAKVGDLIRSYGNGTKLYRVDHIFPEGEFYAKNYGTIRGGEIEPARREGWLFFHPTDELGCYRTGAKNKFYVVVDVTP
jgi:hypothetical protein